MTSDLDDVHSRPVLFEATSLSHPRTGIGNYTAELAKALRASGRPVVALLWPTDDAGVATQDLTDVGVEVRRPRLMAAEAYWAAARLARPPRFERIAGRARAVVFPNYRRFPTAAPALTTIHDLTHILHPECIEPGFRSRLAARSADAVAHSHLILADTHSVRGEILAAYRVEASRVVVVHAAATALPDPDPKARTIPGAILAVGTLEPRKNLLRLIDAHASLPERFRLDHPLVLIGRPSYRAAETLTRIAADRCMVHIASASPAELSAWYASARVLAQVSLYEGFGLPVVEALAAGLPVVVSDIPVLHEVTGGAALAYVDPYDCDSIAAGLCTNLSCSMDRDSLRLAAARYSWPQSAASLASAIDLIT